MSRSAFSAYGYDKQGYAHVRLSKDGRMKLFKVHVLVAEAFLGYDHTKYDMHDINTKIIHHRDWRKLNNELSNLEIMTRRELINLFYAHLRNEDRDYYEGIKKERGK